MLDFYLVTHPVWISDPSHVKEGTGLNDLLAVFQSATLNLWLELSPFKDQKSQVIFSRSKSFSVAGYVSLSIDF